MRILHTNNFHFYGYTPRGHQHRRRHALGVTIRARARHRWRWMTLMAYWPRPDLREGGRGVVSVEWVTYLTDDSMKRSRVGGYKTFVRLKVGLGGGGPVNRNAPRFRM